MIAVLLSRVQTVDGEPGAVTTNKTKYINFKEKRKNEAHFKINVDVSDPRIECRHKICSNNYSTSSRWI